MRRLRPDPALFVGLTGLTALACLALYAGCGSGTPTNFRREPKVQVDAALAATVDLWVGAQQARDPEALHDLYSPDYSFNGMDAEAMAHVGLLPDTPGTQVRSIDYEFIAPSDGDREQSDEAPRRIAARLVTAGKVSADYLRHLAVGEPAGHEHSHDRASHEEDEPIPGLVRARSTYDIIWEFSEASGKPLIVRQVIAKGELGLGGGGVSAPLLDGLHVHPDAPHAEEMVDIHGQYAALPPGGEIEVSIGPHTADATLDAGEFTAEVEAPHTAGNYAAQVKAFGGSVQSRTAALTVTEKGVTVQ
jgi:hypothetical protein